MDDVREQKKIRIACTGTDAVDFTQVEAFQGGLKERAKEDIAKIKTSIIKYGFSAPLFIWKHDEVLYNLDGHGRIEAIAELFEDGYEIPELPVIYIDAKDKKEAKQKLLRINSAYGKMTKESVLEFADGMVLDTEEIQLPDGLIYFGDNDIDIPNDDEGKKSMAERLCPHCGMPI